MSEKSIEEKVKDIIVEQLGVNPEQVTPNASFIEDLGADSLDTVELVMAFEEEFSVEVPDEDAEKLQTVGDVVRYIEERAKEAHWCDRTAVGLVGRGEARRQHWTGDELCRWGGLSPSSEGLNLNLSYVFGGRPAVRLGKHKGDCFAG